MEFMMYFCLMKMLLMKNPNINCWDYYVIVMEYMSLYPHFCCTSLMASSPPSLWRRKIVANEIHEQILQKSWRRMSSLSWIIQANCPEKLIIGRIHSKNWKLCIISQQLLDYNAKLKVRVRKAQKCIIRNTSLRFWSDATDNLCNELGTIVL